MGKVAVLTHIDRMSLFYSLYPIFTDDNLDEIEIYSDERRVLNTSEAKTLLILRYYRFKQSPSDEIDVDTKSLKVLSDKFGTVIFFDDADGAADTRFEVMPYVDRYLKKQLLRDSTKYERRLYGRQLFTDYYHNEYGVNDKKEHYRIPLQDKHNTSKIELSWNLGAGRYPIYPYLQKIGVLLARIFGENAIFWRYRSPSIAERVFNEKEKYVHAHFKAGSGRKTVDFQRETFISKINNRNEFRTGIVNKRKYDINMSNAMMALSPFGWGEVCFRDFEAVLSGATLMKPDMSHIHTWPDIYHPYETYIPVSWDGSDIIEKANYYLERPQKCREMSINAVRKWLNSLNTLGDRVREKIFRSE